MSNQSKRNKKDPGTKPKKKGTEGTEKQAWKLGKQKGSKKQVKNVKGLGKQANNIKEVGNK